MKDQIIEYLNSKTDLWNIEEANSPETDGYKTEDEYTAVATYAESLADKQSVEFGEWLRSEGWLATDQLTTAQLFEIFKKERDEKQ